MLEFSSRAQTTKTEAGVLHHVSSFKITLSQMLIRIYRSRRMKEASLCEFQDSDPVLFCYKPVGGDFENTIQRLWGTMIMTMTKLKSGSPSDYSYCHKIIAIACRESP